MIVIGYFVVETRKPYVNINGKLWARNQKRKRQHLGVVGMNKMFQKKTRKRWTWKAQMELKIPNLTTS